MFNFSDKSNFLWSMADLLRDHFKRSQYQDVILPFTVLRRIDWVLEPTKEQVLKTYYKYKKDANLLHQHLCQASGFAFYNISPYTFKKLIEKPQNLAANLETYIDGFSLNMREVLAKYELKNTIIKLEKAGLLFLIMDKFYHFDLHPERVSNIEMGYIFEDLIRRFNEALNENPGEHFTPREVIRLMVSLLCLPHKKEFLQDEIFCSIYDPCCGSGGMLTTAKNMLSQINKTAIIQLFGQEVNPETFAVCKSDLYLTSADGKDAENIRFGSTLTEDKHAGMTFDYMLSNPPYGKEWKADEKAVKAEYARGFTGRFGVGYPRINDGQLLFLQHMLSKMKPLAQGGSRIAIITNGSPLFIGDAGSGESEIRRWIIENDWLEAIIALPEQLFYNTAIATYIWILTNKKATKRQGKVQLIMAQNFFSPINKSLGDKRREITALQADEILALYEAFTEGKYCRIFNNSDFGYRKIVVERPLRVNYQASLQRIESLTKSRTFRNLAAGTNNRPEEDSEGCKLQRAILAALNGLPEEKYTDRKKFEKLVKTALDSAGIKTNATLFRAIIDSLAKKDKKAPPFIDNRGNLKADPKLRDTEDVPLQEDVYAYFKKKVKPRLPDAWLNEDFIDGQDKQIGKVGYGINFNRYFCEYKVPRPLLEVETELKQLEDEIKRLFQEMLS